jgi:hypothetical protein
MAAARLVAGTLIFAVLMAPGCGDDADESNGAPPRDASTEREANRDARVDGPSAADAAVDHRSADAPATDAPAALDAFADRQTADAADASADSSIFTLTDASADAPGSQDAGEDSGDTADSVAQDATASWDASPGDGSTPTEAGAVDTGAVCSADAAALGSVEWRVGCSFQCAANPAAVECFDDTEESGTYVVIVSQSAGASCPGGPSRVLVQFAPGTPEPGDYDVAPPGPGTAHVEIQVSSDFKTWVAREGTVTVSKVGEQIEISLAGLRALAGVDEAMLRARITCP